ncbi:MAG: hypothetical protein CL859_07275 [Cyanobium sp. ARS6]|nr:hypothetical protein [Cyanobium sp. ARS6]|tara:strand:- start:394 stop:762 length:369 start_codon:yes stop_codon:yes gene_type:complete
MGFGLEMDRRDLAMRGTFSTVVVDRDTRSMQDIKNHSQWERPAPTAIFAVASGGRSNATKRIPVGQPHVGPIKETFNKTKVHTGDTKPQNVAPASLQLGAIPHGYSIPNPLCPHHTVYGENK